MHLSEERIYYLLKCYTEGTSNEAEEQELYAWAQAAPDDAQVKRYIAQLIRRQEETFEGVDWDGLYRRISADIPGSNYRRAVKRKYWLQAAAIALILILGGGSAYWFSWKENPAAPPAGRQKVSAHHDVIRPGGTKAILQAGGDRVVLSGTDTSFTLAGNRVQINEGDVKIEPVNPVQYTLTVPRGGTYSMILADGSRVWLNADSRMEYPSVFTGGKREVGLTGEAYFEVQKDAARPFIVKLNLSGKQDEAQIKVLGTSFNVQAYREEDDAVATLVSGKVQVSNKDKQLVLLPGQQALMNPKGRLELNSEADIEQVVAWKNGYFRFDRADIHTIMDQLARWYDITVGYSNDLQPHHFGAIISRDNDISGILKMLEATGDVHFRIEGHEITVMR